MDDTPALRTVTREVRLQLGADTRFAASWEGLSGFWVSFASAPTTRRDTGIWVMLPIEQVIAAPCPGMDVVGPGRPQPGDARRLRDRVAPSTARSGPW